MTSITMYQLPAGFDLPVSVSPYCAKLEVYLRLTGREYETAQGDVRNSPNSKVPYVRWPDGAIVADSATIIERLEREGPSLDDGLAPDLLEAGSALEKRVEDKLYFACLYARFVAPSGWAHQKALVKELVPTLLSPVLVPIIRRSQVKLCRQNGFADDGGYPDAIGVIEQVEEMLGDKPYLLSDEPSVVDCMTWATVMHTAHTLSDNPARRAIRDRPSLVAYIERMAKRAHLDMPPLRG